MPSVKEIKDELKIHLGTINKIVLEYINANWEIIGPILAELQKEKNSVKLIDIIKDSEKDTLFEFVLMEITNYDLSNALDDKMFKAIVLAFNSVADFTVPSPNNLLSEDPSELPILQSAVSVVPEVVRDIETAML